jgi:hypothetical protein
MAKTMKHEERQRKKEKKKQRREAGLPVTSNIPSPPLP